MKLIYLPILLFLLSSCSSYKQFQYLSEDFEIPTKVFKADFNQAWQSVLQVMHKYDLSYQSQEVGIIKTRWIDNTLELNFADSFGSRDAVKAAKFKIVINIVKGFRGQQEVAKITVFRRQMVESDFLQGWKVIPSDGIMEQTVLYRIGRVLAIDIKLKEIEKIKAKEAEDNF